MKLILEILPYSGMGYPLYCNVIHWVVYFTKIIFLPSELPTLGVRVFDTASLTDLMTF